jgi:hypothetical protein
MRGLRGAVVLGVVGTLAGGCRQLFGIDDTDVVPADAPVAADAGPDGGPPPPDASPCNGTLYGTGLLQICLAQAPTAPLAFSGSNLDTDTYVGCLAGQDPAYCVVAATDFWIVQGTLRLGGSRPLVVVADTIRIQGHLDAGTRTNGVGPYPNGLGPGANSALCLPPTAPVLVADSGGGGAGGSFQGPGGNGGTGTNPGSTGGVAAAATPPDTVTTLRGGCAGDGGVGPLSGAGGSGGGAVYLIATQSIDILATINASGSGAGGGERQAGVNSSGGGGGSGGMIGLDAPTITNQGQVFANGGGGGEGGNNGQDGESPANATMPARGGGSGGLFDSGGNGSAGTELAGRSGLAGSGFDGAGGGGGGGAGLILVYSPNGIGGTVSPLPLAI